jgi:hypothetical protein
MGLFKKGSGLSIPGIEAVFEYGNVSQIDRDHFPGAMLINDKDPLERVRLQRIDGLSADPEGSETRSPSSDVDGERVGNMSYRGRTVGLSGKFEAGNIEALRDVSGRFARQFGKREQDLLIHPPRETVFSTNLVDNPDFKYELDPWSAFTSTGGSQTVLAGYVDGLLTTARVSTTGASSSGTIGIDQAASDWNGEDLFLSILVKVVSATGTVDSIQAYAAGLIPSGFVTVASSGFIVGSPAPTGGWAVLSGVIPASTIAPTIRRIGMLVQVNVAGAGDYVVQFARACAILLGPGDPTPIAFTGDYPNFEWTGAKSRSRSVGPLYSQNCIRDPRFSTELSGLLVDWIIAGGSGITVNQFPVKSIKFQGELSGSSAYFKITKDATLTPRKMLIYPRLTNGLSGGVSPVDPIPVTPGRLYRWSAYVKMLDKPADDALDLNIHWVGSDGGVIVSTSSVVDASPGSPLFKASMTSSAPSTTTGVVGAYVSVGCIAATTPSGVVEMHVSDPCFVDITEYEADAFVGAGDLAEESAGTFAGARRRLTRPFLLRGVRKTPSDYKSDEQQQNMLYERDFTMSLRARDPRIYVLDERRTQIQMTGTSLLVAHQPPSGFTLETAGLPVPSGYTYEGGYITHPGSGDPYVWATRIAVGSSSPGSLPNGGVAPRAYSLKNRSPWNAGSNTPAQDLRTRVYRSAEGYTYYNPKVILGCAPAVTPISNFNVMGYAFSGSPGSETFYYNDATVVVKRVSSSTWIEMRWTALSKAASGNESNAPYAFELWCSHNAAGTLSTTRLAGWDYQSYDSASRLYPFSPADEPMWFVALMQDNVVKWELWSSYPNQIDLSKRIESGEYFLPLQLVGLLGAAVQGSTGWALRIGNGTSDSTFRSNALRPPFVHYFESYDASLAPKTTSVPVIGSIDTPQRIELRGGLVDPIVSIAVPEFQDQPPRTSTARFTGTISDAAPIVVDLWGDSSVRDRFGQSAYSMLVPGYDFAMFRPGVNHITVQAKSWGNYPVHLLASWRDALSSG